MSNDGRGWAHVGTDETYIALSQAVVEPERRWTPYQGLQGVNHLAYEVDDVQALCGRMKSAAYRDSTPPNAHPYRRRVYFYDPEGNDWEFIQYLSQDPAKATITSCQIDSIRETAAALSKRVRMTADDITVLS